MKTCDNSVTKKRNQKIAILTLISLFVILSGVFILSRWQNNRISPLVLSQNQSNSFVEQLDSLQNKDPEARQDTTLDYYLGDGYDVGNNEHREGESRAYSNLLTAEGEFKLNDSVFSVLDSNGVARKEIISLINVAKPDFDLGKISVGRKYSIISDEEGRLLQFNFELDDERLIDFQRSESSVPAFNLEVQKLQFDKKKARLYGEIEDSLYSAIINAGGEAQLAMSLADIFAWQIDFLTDIRKGDKFRILYEELYRKGELIKYGKILAAEVENDRQLYQAFYYKDPAGHEDYYSLNGESLKKAFLKSPLSYRRVSSVFTANRFHPILKTVLPHFGVDYAAPVGTPVVSVAEGKVAFTGNKGGLGRFIKVEHFGNYSTGYAHLSRFAKGIRKGATVNQGQVIGYVGATGLASGPHLDYRVWYKDRYIDPLNAKLPRSKPVPAKFVKQYKAIAASLLADLKSQEDFTLTAAKN